MLPSASTALTSNNQRQQSPGIASAQAVAATVPITTSSSSSMSITPISSPTTIKKSKCESYVNISSPCSENLNSQNVEDSSNNNIKNNTISSGDANASDNPNRDAGATVGSSVLRQNSNNSNACSVTVNASSPNNASEHSNSSNVSPNLSQATVDAHTDVMSEHNSEKLSKKKVNNLKEEDRDKLNSSSSCPSKMSIPATLNNMSAVKEDSDVLSNLVSVKKDDTAMSPTLSPIGFGSLNNVSGSIDSVGRVGTPTKTNELSSHSSSGNNSEGSVRLCASTSIVNSDETVRNSIGVVSSTHNSSVHNTKTNELCNDNVLGGTSNIQNSPGNSYNNNCGGNVIANCMDYMQQQNHIFVFSTQLANKSAESVLNGQFPTIIAYHCTQPATKNFLEDFFTKNPMKVTKLRQNSLHMSVGVGQSWMGITYNTTTKTQQKQNSNKVNFTNVNTNAIESNKPPSAVMRPADLGIFPNSSDTLRNDNDLMCWEHVRSTMDSRASDSNSVKMLDVVDTVDSQHAINSHGSDHKADTDGNIPSLQGVKVPDENLTPQQRQHREEQLAKLKKMNQFLFPENGDFRSDAVPLGKLSVDSLPVNSLSTLINIPGSGAQIMPQMGNKLNPSVRNVPQNTASNAKSVCNSENLLILGDENIIAQDVVGAPDISILPCSQNKVTCGGSAPINSQSTISRVMGGMTTSINIGNITSNSLVCHANSTSGNNTGITGSNNNLLTNSPEMISNFNQTCSASSENIIAVNNQKAVGGPTSLHNQEMGQTGMAQLEWSKLQNQFFEERLKSNTSDMSCVSSSLARSNSTGMGLNLRPNTSISCATSGTNTRTAQGPPPPYHPTQRSASVPIATQSPNPASPNNPTSNLSLPSPRTAGVLGMTTNSPNVDVSSVSSVSTVSVVSTTTTTSISPTGTKSLTKNSFQQDNSPKSSSGGNHSRNRNTTNQFNSNPSTPLSHVSPKELDSFNINTSTADLKSTRPSPQGPRSPIIMANNNNLVEVTNAETRFPNASPGLNFPGNLQNSSSNHPINFKGPGSLERLAPMPSQFCRRSDNIPLNPNSSRSAHSKITHAFDPISSLAQMSQQLTSCVALNNGIGTNSNNIGVLGSSSDINMTANIHMDGVMSSLESVMDHCNSSSSGSMGNVSQSTNMSGSFVSSNCHIIGSMGQRLLNPKICGSGVGGFNHANGNGMRETHGGFHGMMPSHRMINRMSANLGNFNGSPNIQVKASTPNTIQYMPVRPQNNNTSMRVPPSLEFLQRYANPQMMGGGGCVIDNSHMSQHNTNAPNELNKISGLPSNMSAGMTPNSQTNFFQNCDQMNSIGLVDQEELQGVGLLPTPDINIGPHGPLLRGVRPMRQHSMSHGVGGPRTQQPTTSNLSVGPNGVPHFSGTEHDSMVCDDPSALFNTSGAESIQMFAGVQQKSKPVANSNVPNGSNSGPGANNGLMSNEQNQTSIPSPVLLGSNNNNLLPNTVGVLNSESSPITGGVACSATSVNGNLNYKSFVGPSSNDIKYAQQYHSFQQQLYATSTRNQQPGNVSSSISPSANLSSGFFVNK